MIIYKSGNLFQELGEVEALINTINCVGVMGKGIALEFANRYPSLLKEYKKKCELGEIQIGSNYVFDVLDDKATKYIINFPTKLHWRNNSKLEYIEKGLDDLLIVVKEKNIKSIAMPALGCGNGNLDWSVVKTLIEGKLTSLNEVDFIVYEPSVNKGKINDAAVKKPKLTKDRKILLMLMSEYNNFKTNSQITYREVNQLSYLFQSDNSKLHFELSEFGPYSKELNNVLASLSSYYIKPIYNESNDEPTKIEIPKLKIPDKKTLISDRKFKITKEILYQFSTQSSLRIFSVTFWFFNEYTLTGESLINKVLEWLVQNNYKVDEFMVRKAASYINMNFNRIENLSIFDLD